MRIKFHCGSTSQLPEIGIEVSNQVVKHLAGLDQLASPVVGALGGGFGAPPRSAKLRTGVTHMMTAPRTPSISRSAFGGTMSS